MILENVIMVTTELKIKLTQHQLLVKIFVLYFSTNIDCYCHPLGSNSSVCESYGGQCPCKLGVEGRDCSRCKPGFYSLTATGCTRKFTMLLFIVDPNHFVKHQSQMNTTDLYQIQNKDKVF